MAIVQIQFRRDNTTNWTTENPILASGEPAYDTDTKQIKIGDGTNYNDITSSFYGSDQSTKTTDDVLFNSTLLSNLTFQPSGSDQWEEGKIEYCNIDKALRFYNDDATLDPLILGQGTRMRVYNDTTSSIDKGKIVTVVNVTSEGVPIVDLAIASDEISSLNVVGMASHNIQPNSYGYVTTRGFLRNVDSSALDSGALIYLSETVPGEATIVQPDSPNWTVKLGGVAKQDAADGVFYVELLVLDNLRGFHNLFNGSVLENITITTESDGTDVILTVDNIDTGSNYISLIFDSEFHKFEVPASITLLSGSDTNPVDNYVYINYDTHQLTINEGHFPQNAPYIPIASTLVQTPATVQTYGVLKIDKWSSFLTNKNNLGQLIQVSDWIRVQPVTWISGNVFGSSEAYDTLVSSFDISFTYGFVRRFNYKLTLGWDTGNTAVIHIINDSISPYRRITSFSDTDIPLDSNGDSLNNKYYNVVLWATAAQDIADSSLFLTLPTAGYAKVSDAINDVNSTTNYSIPTEYLGSGYLLVKLTLQNKNGNISIISDGIKDLRGLNPSLSAGGGTTGGSGITTYTELTDTAISRVGKANSVVFVKDDELSDDYSNTLFANDTTNTVTVSGSFQLEKDAPSSNTDSGAQGEIRVDDDYVYVKTSTNWKRISLTDWT